MDKTCLLIQLRNCLRSMWSTMCSTMCGVKEQSASRTVCFTTHRLVQNICCTSFLWLQSVAVLSWRCFLLINYEPVVSPASEVSRGVYWNQTQKNFTHQIFWKNEPYFNKKINNSDQKFFRIGILGCLAATCFYKWPISSNFQLFSSHLVCIDGPIGN